MRSTLIRLRWAQPVLLTFFLFFSMGGVSTATATPQAKSVEVVVVSEEQLPGEFVTHLTSLQSEMSTASFVFCTGDDCISSDFTGAKLHARASGRFVEIWLDQRSDDRSEETLYLPTSPVPVFDIDDEVLNSPVFFAIVNSMLVDGAHCVDCAHERLSIFQSYLALSRCFEGPHWVPDLIQAGAQYGVICDVDLLLAAAALDAQSKWCDGVSCQQDMLNLAAVISVVRPDLGFSRLVAASLDHDLTGLSSLTRVALRHEAHRSGLTGSLDPRICDDVRSVTDNAVRVRLAQQLGC